MIALQALAMSFIYCINFSHVTLNASIVSEDLPTYSRARITNRKEATERFIENLVNDHDVHPDQPDIVLRTKQLN